MHDARQGKQKNKTKKTPKTPLMFVIIFFLAFKKCINKSMSIQNMFAKGLYNLSKKYKWQRKITYQISTVKNVDFTILVTARIGQVAVVIVN